MRRRKSMRFSSRSGRSSGGGARRGWLVPALGAVALLAGFIYLVRVADGTHPPQKEVHVAVPNAFDRAQ